MARKRFLRRVWKRHSKLGKGRKKIQKWKRPTGRDNKMREKRRGYPAVVSIGYKKPENSRQKINSKEVLRVNNINDLKKATKDNIIVIGKIGKRKKIEVMKKAQELGLNIHKTNLNKFIKKNTKQKKEKVPEKTKKEKKERKAEEEKKKDTTKDNKENKK